MYSKNSAYGEVTFEDAAGASYATQESLYGNDLLYASYLYEPEVDHYWLKFRVYDPNTGKFLTTDPIGVWGDAANWGNGYGCAGCNPLAGIDSTGLFFETLWDIANVVVDVGTTVAGAAATATSYAPGKVAQLVGADDYADTCFEFSRSCAGVTKNAAADTLLDLAATTIPGVPAGAAKVMRAVNNTRDTVAAAEAGANVQIKGKQGPCSLTR